MSHLFASAAGSCAVSHGPLSSADYGESHGWPRVSSAYGQFDLAGFQKNTARWYRTWWLSAVPTSDASRPVGFGPSHMCFPYIDRRKEISVETEAATVELYEDGKKAGTATVAPLQTATLKATSGVKNYTTVCRSADGSVTASGTLMKAGNATKIMLSLDAPSAKTGTGTALVLDGHDAAMLRATVVDSAGVTVGSSAANISFVVTAGPGRVLATHNGDNACHVSHGPPASARLHRQPLSLLRAGAQPRELALGVRRAGPLHRAGDRAPDWHRRRARAARLDRRRHRAQRGRQGRGGELDHRHREQPGPGERDRRDPGVRGQRAARGAAHGGALHGRRAALGVTRGCRGPKLGMVEFECRLPAIYTITSWRTVPATSLCHGRGNF